MKISHANVSFNLFMQRIFIMLVCIFAAGITVSAQIKFEKFTTLAAPAATAAPSANLDQCANGGSVGTPDVRCIGEAWVNGNLNPQKSHYQEGDFVPYRLKFQDLDTTIVHTVIIEYDIYHSSTDGKRAIDYLGTYNAGTETDADPCSDVLTAALCAAPSTTPIPMDDETGVLAQVAGVFTLWGGTLLSAEYVDYVPGSIKQQVIITFYAHVSNPVLAWSGHLADRNVYGLGNTAGDINGAPYHMRFISLDGSGGNQDRSLQIDQRPGGITAADGSISGRVARADGSGIYGAKITVTNAVTGEARTVLTSPFGNYMLEGLETADLYQVSVRHRRYTFENSMRTFTLNDNVAELDFTANQ
ncbi:MAG: carboxypeptidase-like regulatory domain-containing protein [Acidobacteriota bacterium]|nr:carboxypeptidase-like regulatory domain-containing protein [Acidobacteriota bacterium]